MLDTLLRRLLPVALVAIACEVSAQPRETTVERSSEDALKVMRSPDFRVSTQVVPGGAGETDCASRAFDALRTVPRVISGWRVDGTTVAAHTRRSVMLVMCLEAGGAARAHVMVASDDTAESAMLLRLAQHFTRMNRTSDKPGATSFDNPAARSQAGRVQSPGIKVGYRARREITADRCVQEVRQAMRKSGANNVRVSDDLIVGTSSEAIAVAVCAPGAERTNYQLAAFGADDNAATRLRDAVTAAIPGRPGEKPQLLLHPRARAEMIRRPNP